MHWHNDWRLLRDQRNDEMIQVICIVQHRAVVRRLRSTLHESVSIKLYEVFEISIRNPAMAEQHSWTATWTATACTLHIYSPRCSTRAMCRITFNIDHECFWGTKRNDNRDFRFKPEKTQIVGNSPACAICAVTQCYADTAYASFTRQAIEHPCDPLIHCSLRGGQYLPADPFHALPDLFRTERI